MLNKYILAIETSCDDTSIGYISLDGNIIRHYSYNQIDHAKYKGVVPTLAARQHLEKIQEVMQRVLQDIELSSIAAVAVTVGPGLIASLMIGWNYANMLSYLLNVDCLPIHHLEGHMFSAFLKKKIEYPYLTLLVSGGHTQYILAKSFMNYEILGSSIDDALGEAFDKVGIMLGLEYPAGPKVEELAKLGDKYTYCFPIALSSESGKCNFSFSGLKTSVLRLINQGDVIGKNILSTSLNTTLTNQEKYNIAASFQYCVANTLLAKTKIAFNILSNRNINIKSFILVGGVSANQYISSILSDFSRKIGVSYIQPELPFCMDNGSMIARAGLEYFNHGCKLSQNYAIARWSLEDIEIEKMNDNI